MKHESIFSKSLIRSVSQNVQNKSLLVKYNLDKFISIVEPHGYAYNKFCSVCYYHCAKNTKKPFFILIDISKNVTSECDFSSLKDVILPLVISKNIDNKNTLFVFIDKRGLFKQLIFNENDRNIDFSSLNPPISAVVLSKLNSLYSKIFQ